MLISLSAICFGDEVDFRKVRWGMTKIEVISSEDLKPESFAGPSITYRTLLLGKEMYLIYEFIDNKLIDAVYLFLAETENDYTEIERIISKKYGEPISKRNTGITDFYYKWDTPLTEILLQPDKGKTCRVEYFSKKLRKYRLKQEKRQSVKKEQELLSQF